MHEVQVLADTKLRSELVHSRSASVARKSPERGLTGYSHNVYGACHDMVRRTATLGVSAECEAECVRGQT